MPTKWYQAELTAVKEIAPNTRLFNIKIPEVETFFFKPGQFVTLDLPVHEKRLYRWKSYSICNHYNPDHDLELCIVRNPNGLGTKYLFENFQVGSTIPLKGPEGNFILPEIMPKRLTFICTGTGIAPFRSMLKELCKNPADTPPIDLIFGTRNAENILFLHEWLEMTDILPDFQVHIALSKEPDLPTNSSSKVHFYKGYLHQAYLNFDPLHLKETIFYICGWQNMVDEVKENFVQLNLPPSNIKTELYG